MALTLDIVAGRRGRTPVKDIHPEIISTVQEAWDYARLNPQNTEQFSYQFTGTLPYLEAETGKGEADEFLHLARSYAYAAEPRLVVTGNATQKGLVKFRVDLYVKDEATPQEQAGGKDKK